MAGYYIQGLLNTETAWDSYCIYGYKSDIDKRYFCAVQTSNVFYASRRESAYINIYIYCKGQQVSTLKCISNTGSEYNISTQQYSTADPTVTRIYEHDVWSNMNGRQTTIADFLSNAPILNGVNLSDTERDALAINYLNNVPEPYGQGTVTLSIKKPGQTLNFASRLLGKTISQYISEDAIIDIQNASSDWEVFYDAKFGSNINAVLSVDSNFNSHYATPYNSEVIGSLLERNLSDQSGDNIYALDNIYGCRTYPQAGSISFSQFATGDVVSVSSWNNVYSRITIAKKTSGNTLPFEVLFIWHDGWSAERTLIKRDGTQYGNDVTITGEFITGHITLSGSYPEEVTIAPFNGMIKIYKNGDSVISASGSSGYSFSSSDTAIWMILAIPS